MGTYDGMTNGDFERHLFGLLENMTAAQLLMEIPSIYSEVSEHFNNDVLDAWSMEQESHNAN